MAAGCVIGVDLGGTKLLAGAVDVEASGPEVHHRAYRLAPRGDDVSALLDVVVDEVNEVRSTARSDIVAVGFGIPSLIDRARGVAVQTVHLPLTDIPFAALMSERLGLPVEVDNDANCAMLAEHRFGAARGARHALLLTLGTGIGGGAVIDGRLLRGAVGAAAELGHMVVDSDGAPCHGSCPNRGCLETVASGTALGRAARAAAEAHPSSALGRALTAGTEITGTLATELAYDGDPVAREVVARVGEMLGVGIASLVNVFNPEVVVIGGGVIAAGDLLLDPARRVVAERALAPSRDARIVPARFGADAGMLGAALLAQEALA